MNNNLGEFIKNLRLEKKLTQRELGELIGIDDKTISKWETGIYLPDVVIIPKLCKVLDVTADELLAGKRNEVITEEKTDIVTPVKKKGIIFKVFLVILAILLFVNLTFMFFLKPKSKENDQVVDEPNIYKINSGDNNLIIEGYIFEQNNEYVLVVKKLHLFNVQKTKADKQYTIGLEITIANDSTMIYKSNENDTLVIEGSDYIFDNIETQNISLAEGKEFQNTKISLLYFNEKKVVKEIDYQIYLEESL